MAARLEPLSGYLWLAMQLHADLSWTGKRVVITYGPNDRSESTVETLVPGRCLCHWKIQRWVEETGVLGPATPEAERLKLNCDKVL